jgi:pimeloyl-ACP methyl ester carboxylesterase
MGASAALVYTGTEPERVAALACVDALGPPDVDPETAPDRFARWLVDLERIAERGRVAPAPDDPAARLRERFFAFSDDVARHMAAHGTREIDGVRVWKFDPLHQTISPQPYSVAQARAFWRRITCPTLYVEGAESAFRLDASEVAERCAALRARRVTVAGSGHHPHLERPVELAAILVEFLRG